MAFLVWSLLALVLLIALIFVYYFNRFVVLSNRIENSLSQIDVQLKKRADLVPNLINIVKGYAKHEKSLITEVTNARKSLLAAKDLSSRVKAGDKLQSALKSIFALAESYPNLKANENFLHLQQELSAIEDKIAYARQYYNDAILVYNNSCTTFPGLLFARIYNKKQKEFLKISPAEKSPPKIEF